MGAFTAETPASKRQGYQRSRLSLIGLACCLLTACGGGSSESSTPLETQYSSQPLNLVLRPGESDTFETAADGDDFFYDPHLTRQDSDIALSTSGPCAIPYTGCNSQQVGAPTNPIALPHLLAFIEHSSTTLTEPSYTPVVLMDSVPQAAPPIIDFSIAGDGEGRITQTYNRGRSTALALDSSGLAWSWGEYDNATESAPPYSVTHGIPHQVTGIDRLLSVKAGIPYAAAIRDDGTVWSWRTLEPATGLPLQEQPTQVPGLSNIIAVAPRNNEGYAIRNDGTLWHWLRDTDGTMDPANVTQVAGIESVTQIALGDAHVLTLRSDGSVWSWGSNLFNQLGAVVKDSTNGTVPHQVQGVSGISEIAAGGEFSMVLTQAGQIRGWGSDAFGQLGGAATETCTDISSSVPCTTADVRLNSLQNVLQIAAGRNFALARLNDGSVWAWGDNRLGQLGELPGFQSNSPVQVPGLASSIAIRAGGATGMAVQTTDSCSVNSLSAGRIMAWGDNTTGLRGDGTAINWLRPTPVLTLGDDSTCANLLGNRLVIYKSGTGSGSVSSSAPGLTCSGNLCWQAVTPNTTVTLTATADAGSQFMAWRWDCASSALSSTLQLDQIRHCKVIFDRTGVPPHSLEIVRVVDQNGVRSTGAGARVTSTPTGIDCPGDCFETYDADTPVALSASSDSSYTFLRWEGAGCTTGSVTMSSDHICYAVFIPVEAPFNNGLIVAIGGEVNGVVTANTGGTVSSSPVGISCPEDCSQAYTPGTQVTLTATPDSGYSFAGWNTENGCSDGVVTIPTATIQCTARFVANTIPSGDRTLTLTIEGGPGAGEVRAFYQNVMQMDCINSAEPTTICSSTFTDGAQVNLAATAFRIGEISHWSGCDGASDIEGYCLVNMNTDRQISVLFGP